MSFIGKEMSPVGLRQEEDYTVSYFQWLDYEAEQKKQSGQDQKGIYYEERVKSRIETACDFLIERLSDGPVESRVLYEEAKAKGIPPATLNRAKQRVRVQSKRKSDRSWLWELTEEGDVFLP